MEPISIDTFDALVAPMVRAIAPIAPRGRRLSELVLAYAEQQLAESPTEVGGSNRGPWVRLYMEWRGEQSRQWCAGFAGLGANAFQGERLIPRIAASGIVILALTLARPSRRSAIRS